MYDDDEENISTDKYLEFIFNLSIKDLLEYCKKKTNEQYSLNIQVFMQINSIMNKIVNSERKNIDNFPIKKNYISEVKEEESKTVNKNNTNKTIQNLNFSPLLENNKKINEHNYPKHSNIQSGRNENKK